MSRRFFWVLCLVISWVPLGSAVAQQSATYGEEFALYQQAEQTEDWTERKRMLLQFVERFPESRLDPNVSYLYAQYLETFRGRSDWNSAASEAEGFLKFRPADERIAAIATEAYQKLGQPSKLAAFGTRLYDQAPSAATAYLVAKAYQSMNDRANFRKWAESTLRHAPQNVEMRIELANAAWMARDLPTAAQHARTAIEVLEAQPENPEAKPTLAFAYRALGEDAYVRAEFNEARKSFEKAAELQPTVDFTHLRLGYCYWRSNQIEDAIRSFARAVALKGSSRKEARTQLYDLLKQRFGDASRARQLIEEAEKELGPHS